MCKSMLSKYFSVGLVFSSNRTGYKCWKMYIIGSTDEKEHESVAKWPEWYSGL